MIRGFSIILLALLPQLILAQDKIEADRPSETQSSQTLSQKQFQAEIGFQKKKQNAQDYTVQHPDALFRFGITDKIELRARLLSETQKLYTENEFRYGLEPLELGLKINLLETSDKKFSTSFLGHVGIPTLSSKDHDPGKAFHRLRLLFENEITDKIKLGYNVGTEWNSEDQHQNWVFTVSPQFELSDHWQIYIEEFSFLQEHHLPEHHLQGGLAYIIGKNIQVDANTGFGLNAAAPDYFINAGLSFRLGK